VWCARSRRLTSSAASCGRGRSLSNIGVFAGCWRDFAYFGITGNYQRLEAVVHQTRRIWRKWLSRRSWKSYVTWAQFLRLVATYPLPAPRIVHRYA